MPAESAHEHVTAPGEVSGSGRGHVWPSDPCGRGHVDTSFLLVINQHVRFAGRCFENVRVLK